MAAKRTSNNQVTPEVQEDKAVKVLEKPDENRKNRRLSVNPPKHQENRRKSIDPNYAEAKMAEMLEREKERQIQKGIEQKEKELQKKLAHHQHDAKASEESIYIAPPAPENKMSVVKLISCGVRGYRRCLLFCCFVLYLDLALQIGLIWCIFIWPMGFGRMFERIKVGGIKWEQKLCLATSATVALVVWLSLVTCCATKTKFCCWKNSTYWCIRGYYAYSVYLLIIPIFGFMANIMYLGTFDYDELELVLDKHLNTYDAFDVSKKNWDETQIYLQCCGVDDDGWRDWQYRDKVQEDVVEWIVPESCCRKGLEKGDQIKCTNETADELVWEGGCARRLYDLYYLYVMLLITSYLVSMAFHCLSVYCAAKLYEAIRETQDPTFKFHIGIYFLECCCCCRGCRPVVLII